MWFLRISEDASLPPYLKDDVARAGAADALSTLAMFFVYILTNKKRGVLYTGATNNLAARVLQHREGAGSRFAWKYGALRLVLVQTFDDGAEAMAQERRIKHWRREWKIALVEATNPDWRDLYDDLLR